MHSPNWYDAQQARVCDEEYEELAREQSTPIRIGRVFAVWLCVVWLAWSLA